MNFDELHELVPFARFGKAKSLTMQPYNGVTLAMPGRHAEDTTPKGGDFVVMVDDEKLGWKMHQFKHSDIFDDIQTKYDAEPEGARQLLEAYLCILNKDGDPAILYRSMTVHPKVGLHPQTFLYAVQCLAVAEHRRYAQHEAKFGGRYLPFRFVAGIAEGLWTADNGSDVQKYGRPAVEKLEKNNGVPILTKELMS